MMDEQFHIINNTFKFDEVRICPCLYFTDRKQFRFPRSKKKRIRKKWAKDKRNWKVVPEYKAVFINGCLYAHPDVLERIRKKVASKIEVLIMKNAESYINIPVSLLELDQRQTINDLHSTLDISPFLRMYPTLPYFI
jgi:hypothetical protein